MTGPHEKESLSLYLDDALAAGETARVMKHLRGCAECRAELEALKAISKAVGALPEADLPVGFMERLERRRLGEAEEDARPAAWFPVPARAAAFAATGLLVCVIFMKEVKYRLAPKMLPPLESPESAGLEEEMDEAMRADLVRARREAALSAPSSAESSAESPAAPRPGGGGALKKDARAPGSPIGPDGKIVEERKSEKGFTNEGQQEYLAKQRAEEGIAKIVPPAPDMDPWSGIPDRPMDRTEAMAAMRTMTSRLATINRIRRDQMSPTVPLGSGTTPRLINAPAPSRPVGGAAAFNAAWPGGKAGGAGSAASRTGLMGTLSSDPAAPKSESLSIVRQAADQEKKERAAVRRKLSFRRSWTGSENGLGVAGGAVIRDPESLADLWARVKFSPERPSLDFSKEMVVAVFGTARADEKWKTEIVSVVEEEGGVVIRYRSAPVAGTTGPTAPYHIAVVDRSPLQFEFIAVE